MTIIRNAQAVKKETAALSYSKLKMEIAKVLVKEKFLKKAEAKGKKNKKIIDLELLYDEEGRPAVNHLARISRPSRRIYLPAKKVKPLKRGSGLQIISTSKGLLTDKETRKEKVGGEILFEIW